MSVIRTEQIKAAIQAQDVETARLHISNLKKLGGTLAHAGLLQEVAEHCPDEATTGLVYLLVAAGANPDSAEGAAALWAAVRRRHLQTLQALLQCGVTPPELLPDQQQCPEEVSTLLEQFRPGLWAAVAGERLGDVRRLLNLWCRTDLCRDGVTLRRRALDTGNEPIISLILNIEQTMKCAFLVLGRDEQGLADLLASPAGKKVNPNFRKQSERGAPLLYFAARSGSVTICRHLMDCGATVGLQMRDEEGADMSLIFALLHPAIPPDVARCVLPPAMGEDGCSSCAGRQGRQLLVAACYRSRNVLTHAVEAGLSTEVIAALLQAVGPELVCERGTDNLCLPERLAGNTALLALLRTTLADWIRGAARDQLVPLLVRGCDWLEPLLAGDGPTLPEQSRESEQAVAGDGPTLPEQHDESEQAVAGDGPTLPEQHEESEQAVAGDGPTLPELHEESEQAVAGDGPTLPEQNRECEQALAGDEARLPAGDGLVAEFLRERRAVQARVDELYQCVYQEGRQDELERLADRLPDHWLWHARPSGDGTPLLLLAALLSRPSAVSRLSRGLAAADTVRDGFRRTALHYASGADSQPVRRALLRAGASEHTLDVNGREPLDFADVIGSERLDELLRMRRDQEYGRPEPDPWEPAHRRALQQGRRRRRFQDPALRSSGHAGHAHFPTGPGSDLRWPLPPDYSRASFAAATPGGADGASSSCVVS